MSLLQLPQDHRPAQATPEVAERLRFADGGFFLRLDLCANALGECVQATKKLSERVSSLRKEIETFAPGRRYEERP